VADVGGVPHPGDLLALPGRPARPFQHGRKIGAGGQLLAEHDLRIAGDAFGHNLGRLAASDQRAGGDQLGRESPARELLDHPRESRSPVFGQGAQAVVGPLRIAVISRPGVTNDVEDHRGSRRLSAFSCDGIIPDAPRSRQQGTAHVRAVI